MEHLTCLSPTDMGYFIEVTQLKVVHFSFESIILKGETLFNYTWDSAKSCYQFLEGTKA